MSINQLPTNRNFLNPTGYYLVINRLPGIVLNCQRVKMPGIKIQPIHTGNPFNKLNYASVSVDYSDLYLEFKVDENLENYLEIMKWMEGLGFPEDFKQYRDLKNNVDGNKGIRSDASLLILTSEKNVNAEVVFREIFPMELSDFNMASTERTAKYVTASVRFSLRDFKFQPINEPVNP